MTPGCEKARHDDDIPSGDICGHYHDGPVVLGQSLSSELGQMSARFFFLHCFLTTFGSSPLSRTGARAVGDSSVHTRLARFALELRDSRHVCIKYQEASLATPDTGDFISFHGHTPLRPLNRHVKFIWGPFDHIFWCHIVVAPEALNPDGENNDDKASLLVVSEYR